MRSTRLSLHSIWFLLAINSCEFVTFSETPGDEKPQALSIAKMGRIYLNECNHFAGRIEFRIVEPERKPFKAYATAVGDFDGDRRDEVIQAGANQMHYFEMR